MGRRVGAVLLLPAMVGFINLLHIQVGGGLGVTVTCKMLQAGNGLNMALFLQNV